jgi:hypothetical protein
MKARFTLLSTCIFLSLSLSGQFRHALQPAFNSFGGNIQVLPDNTIRVIGIAADGYGYGLAVVSTDHFSLDGSYLSSRMHMQLGLEYATDLESMPTRDGHTIVAAAISGCDFSAPVTLGRISDADIVQWHLSEDVIEVYGSEIMLQRIADTLFWISDQHDSSFVSENGLIVHGTLDYERYDKVLLTNDGFIASLDSWFYVLDSTFEITQGLILESDITAFDTLNSGYLIATTDALLRLDPALNVQISATLPVYPVEYFFHTSGYYWVASAGTFYKLDSLLLPIDTFELSSLVELRDVAHVGDSILILGNVWLHDQSMTLIQTTEDSFDLSFPSDVGITSVRVAGDPIAFNVFWPWGGFPVYDVNYGPTYVTLKNFGTAVVEHTYVRFEEYLCPYICEGLLEYEWHITDINLNPGDSIEVYLDDLAFFCAAYPVTQLCLYTINPNQEPDLNISNDMFCANVDVLLDVSDASYDENISIFPNPTTDILYIESNHILNGTMHLIDNHGKTILEKELSAFNSSVSVGGIMPGMYYVVVKIEGDAPFIRKVIVH